MTGLASDFFVDWLVGYESESPEPTATLVLSHFHGDQPMSSSAAAPAVPVAAPSTIYLGLDVHKESITVAVLPAGAAAPTRVDKLSSDLTKLRRYFERLARDGSELRACYEASGAGYVLHRAMREWGCACDVIAPSLIPTRPGVQRKHDKRAAVDVARLYRAGELTAVRIPSEAEERVRDVVRCRETFQRELLKSRHHLLKFPRPPRFRLSGWDQLEQATPGVAPAAGGPHLAARAGGPARLLRVPRPLHR
jgi:hypothetical protein